MATGRPLEATAVAGERPSPAFGRETFSAFQSRPFRYLWLSTFSYNLNQGMQRFAFVWLALRLSTDSGAAGAVAFALGIPVFFLSIPCGILADRFDRRALLFASQAIASVVTLAVAVLLWTDAASLWAVMALAAGVGATVALGQPVRTAVLPTVVDRSRLMNGIILMSMGQNTAQIIGPALGGAAIAIFGIGAAFAVQSAIYAVGLVALIPLRLPATASNQARNVARELREGFGFIRREPGVRVLIVLVVASSLIVIGPVTALVPKIAKEELRTGALGASLLFAGQGVASLATSMLLAARSNMQRRGRLFLFGLMGGGLVFIGIGLSPAYWLTAALMACFGVTGALYMNLNQALIQSHTPPELMGRVMGIHTLGFMGLGPMGALVAGPSADVIGAPATVAIAGSLTFLLALGTFVVQPVLRRMD
ncbi:MAG: MFS transporter [Dehalococcoidia bacterium]